MGPGSGARRTATPPGVHRTQESPVMRVQPRPAGTSPMPVEISAPHTGKNSQKKPPAGALTLLHAPLGKALATRREEHPISRLQHLRDPSGNTHRCSGATVGDSPKGPLNNQGKTRLKPGRNAKHKSTYTPDTHTRHKHGPGGPRGPPGEHSVAPRVKLASLEE
jgi:hypothetical protein